ncbi:hypothetical protein Q7C36_008357 [Tachysurus vachellii]|uniref:Uncharacterized protein n=1 Tax=Tachysurus vachellii TaxID=175792 RepID=A0AA88T0C7_TACVA|nr:hypothetical protein Q7C36_008357 [Tachysurus vachellii]
MSEPPRRADALCQSDRIQRFSSGPASSPSNKNIALVFGFRLPVARLQSRSVCVCLIPALLGAAVFPVINGGSFRTVPPRCNNFLWAPFQLRACLVRSLPPVHTHLPPGGGPSFKGASSIKSVLSMKSQLL